MNSTPDFLSVSENSHRLVLNIIRIQREISGAEIARISGLQPSSVVYILRILEKNGFIQISRTGNSTLKGGKRPTLWQIVPGIGKILGAEVLGDRIRYVIIDFAGNRLKQGEAEARHNLRGEAVVITLFSLLMNILEDQVSETFLGISLGVPGLVDTRNGILYQSALLETSNCNLANQLQRKLNIPVAIINDANAGALSIKWFFKPEAEFPDNIIYLTYNDGSVNLGTGIIVDRQLYHGASGFAGEIFRPLPTLAALMDDGIKFMGNDFPLVVKTNQGESLRFSLVCDLQRQGCQLSSYIAENLCDFISEEIVRLTGLLNPDLIIIGGDIAAGRYLLDSKIQSSVREKIKSLFRYDIPLPEIGFSEFGEFSVSMGAAAYVLSTVLKPVN